MKKKYGITLKNAIEHAEDIIRRRKKFPCKVYDLGWGDKPMLALIPYDQKIDKNKLILHREEIKKLAEQGSQQVWLMRYDFKIKGSNKIVIRAIKHLCAMDKFEKNFARNNYRTKTRNGLEKKTWCLLHLCK